MCMLSALVVILLGIKYSLGIDYILKDYICFKTI